MMKKIILAALSAALLTLNASAAELIPVVYVNGEEVKFGDNINPYIDTERNLTMIPVRGVFEAAGANIVWDGENKAVTGLRNELYFTLQIGEKDAFVNGSRYTLDSPAVIKNDTAFVPLRLAMEALGADVEWDGENYAVRVTVR